MSPFNAHILPSVYLIPSQIGAEDSPHIRLVLCYTKRYTVAA